MPRFRTDEEMLAHDDAGATNGYSFTRTQMIRIASMDFAQLKRAVESAYSSLEQFIGRPGHESILRKIDVINAMGEYRFPGDWGNWK